jgi:exonuclease SbcC
VLASRDAYESAERDIDELRPRAEKAASLNEARGRLGQVEDDLQRVATDLERVEPAHRIDIEDAGARERSVREIEQAAIIAKTQAAMEREGLVERRELAAIRQAEIEAAAGEAYAFGDLATILAEGGPLQNEIVQHQQHVIADEVNKVLALLNDPLYVKLDAPRRKQRVQGIQDILVVDSTDPVGQPRHFAFLSGGEQFRIALALALALHRRVGRSGAGMIIIDEGFGALDGDRRDRLAEQMTNISQGILSLGLAERIVISSHSTEVQRHFPHRWLVRKQGGTATVCCSTEEVAVGGT